MDSVVYSNGRRGGWVTFPFITGSVIGLTLGGAGWLLNLIVYLIQEFHINSIDAAQIFNFVNGCFNLFPVIGAIIADSLLGSFSVILISSCLSLLGITILALTASLDSLRPQPCEMGSTLCKTPSNLQLAVLYSGIALATLGMGGTRFTLATMGANQFDKPQHRVTFFNWYFFAMYASSVISATAIVYMEDNISWKLGFWICVAANLVGLVIFLLGKCFYWREKPQGSPFMSLVRVVVASVRKRKAILSSRCEDYYQDQNGRTNILIVTPNHNFRILNRAALKTEGDIGEDGSIAKRWRLCTVQQVEDFKTLIRIFPLWSSSIFLSTPIGIQLSLVILQALTMDRHLKSHFKIPAGSFLVIVFMSTSIFLTLIDRLLLPLWKKLTRQSPTPLQQIGVGHVFNVIGMVVSALVESKRLKIVYIHNLEDQPNGSMVPVMAYWLFPQLILIGIGEAFHFPGQVRLYYQEFPASMRSTATAMIALVIGISYYLSTALIDVVRRGTPWLPDNINTGRLDFVYWSLVVSGLLNFGYYLACSRLYKYRNVDTGEDISSGSQ